MTYCSFDPYRLELLNEFAFDDSLDVVRVEKGFADWSGFALAERIAYFHRLKIVLQSNAERFARLIVAEVGKPISEARAEISKCCSAIDHFCTVAPSILIDRVIPSEARLATVSPTPFGPLLAILPWNFPFWQLFRFAVPAMLAGNTVLLKHAPNVPQCAIAISNVFHEAGFPEGAFVNCFFSNEGIARTIAHTSVAGVTFTGSDTTGALIGQVAGKHIKKSVLELGGNDPMIVFSDADLDAAVQAAVQSRCINAGQACNGAKRFLVAAEILPAFTERLSVAVRQLIVGDPSRESTQVGPLARLDLLEKVQAQVNQSIVQGARVSAVAEVPRDSGWFYPPTVLSNVQPGMIVFEEEVFGPVWSVTSFTTNEQALILANNSVYGLGASVWSNDDTLLTWIIPRLQTGNVFINDFVRSDPRFPFGGVKRSGYGKELGEAGMLEFVNWKTVYRKK